MKIEFLSDMMGFKSVRKFETTDSKLVAFIDSLMENTNITALSGFNPNAYYFAYNNEFSKDIGLDMSGYSNTADIDVDIYRIHESMPQEFYPIQDDRGIVVKNRGKRRLILEYGL